MSKIIVTSKPERLRRAGLEFTREPTELDTKSLKPEQLKALQDEPLLVVTPVAVEPKK
jgi:hypothetical protein